ncbi:glutaredoxin family protein [Brevibacillus humidisoli]|uniref:glutaredoxin family protein n=1 Tax=Brevibacillus humidisoli TaxID=2895522 RepID=UPI001E62CD87|nr:glutaredoxin family protein [Brevibacillus humidisoli]UFJ39958.1 glutaredoxin family protein [Brevibacillus humidisoli]
MNKQDRQEAFQVVLFGRPGCHLCDEVERRIRAVAAEVPLVLETRSIAEDPVLEEKYMLTIPVVQIDGDEVFLSIDSIMTEEQLRAELQGRRTKRD